MSVNRWDNRASARRRSGARRSIYAEHKVGYRQIGRWTIAFPQTRRRLGPRRESQHRYAMVVFDRIVTVSVQCSGQIFLETMRMTMFGHEHHMFLQGLEQGRHVGRHG